MKSIFEDYPIENGSYDDAVTYVRVLIYVANVDGTSKDELTELNLLSKHINGQIIAMMMP